MSKNENNETNFGYKNVDKREKPEMVKGVLILLLKITIL